MGLRELKARGGRPNDMRRLVLVPLVGVFVLGACGTGERPQLPLSATGAAKGESAMAGGFMPYRNVRYELADGVTTKVDHADAYRYPTATIEDARRVAKAFGVDGQVHDESGGWAVGPTGSPDSVAFRSSLFVGSNGTFSINGASSGVACAEVGAPGRAPQPCATTTTTENANLPTNDTARSIALGAMKSAGVDIEHVSVNVERFGDVVTVTLEPTYGGKKSSSMNQYSVSIGGGGAILSTFGVLGTPEDVGSYELATLQRAVDRLNAGFGRGGGPEPAIAAVDQSPTVVKLTAVSVRVMAGGDAVQLWELPAYVFTAEGDSNPVVTLAAADKYFPTTTTVGSSPSTSGAETKPPASDEVPPSPTTIPPCVSTTDPIPAQVCADHTSLKAGDSVHFTITASDPDRAFQDNCSSDGVSAEYGDDAGGDTRCAMCTTSVPDGPGKISRTRDHTYAKPGNYAAKFTISSGPNCGPDDPRDSTAVLTIAIDVN
ncbi:MAG: hypothetical protein QOK28_3991 [Actinomycetota bacterium]